MAREVLWEEEESQRRKEAQAPSRLQLPKRRRGGDALEVGEALTTMPAVWAAISRS